ncbi:hypothetical protein [Streptomyces sp. NPDC058613]|uniref:hypothetical protein n=1 Tax=Streptomyces sp. NPDC058613 TaxID=3346556 RepID=UPI00365BBA1E
MRAALLGALAELEPVYLHQIHADPDHPLYADIRRAWPGTLIANPALSPEEVAADGGLRRAEALLAGAPTWSRWAAASSPTPTSSSGCAPAHRSTRSARSS